VEEDAWVDARGDGQSGEEYEDGGGEERVCSEGAE
jgi:hypothetical protein